jgi:transcriptional regulator of arginine metabolism
VRFDHEHKESRQRELLSILEHERVTSQLELVERLRGRGISATQSSVSRDLKELGVGWLGGRYVVAEEPAQESSRFDDFARFLRGFRPAGPHLTVVQTTVGTAQSVALAIDRSGWPEVVGTVAGDDTFFVATASVADQRRLLKRLTRYTKER